MIVTLQLSSETAKRLSDKAAREGQSLEGLIENLANHEGEAPGNSIAAANAPEDELSPWRGVFLLDYSRSGISVVNKELHVDDLPTLPVEVLIP